MKRGVDIVDSQRLDFLDSLRAVAIGMVVAIHTFGYVHLTGVSYEIVQFLVYPIAVPVFFLCDGFLFIQRTIKDGDLDYRSFILHSFKRLVLPWLFFSLIYLAVRATFEITGILPPMLVVRQSPLEIGLSVWASKIAPQMYFLLSLFFIRALAPLLKYLGRLSPLWIGAFLFAYTVGFTLTEDSIKAFMAEGLDPVVHALWGLKFYLAGMLLASVYKTAARFAKQLAISCFALVGLLLLIPGENQVVVLLLQAIYLAGAFFLSLVITKQGGLFTRLGSYTMGIYLFHAPVPIGILGRVFVAILGTNLASFSAVVFCGYGVSLVLSVLILKIERLRFLLGIFPKRARGLDVSKKRHIIQSEHSR
ncbi:MAG: acyltransferase [Deltaproteobacteria bacterium]|nr:acyltransferase [Deltaproteobacteria bacterium]